MKNIKARLGKISIYNIIIFALLAWFLFAFLIFPNLNTIYNTFFSSGKFTLEPFRKLFSSERAMTSMKNSFLLAFTLVITVNAVGISLVLITDYFDIKGSTILRISYYTTLIYGGVVLVSGYKFIYGRNGYITQVLSNIFQNYNPNWFEGYWAVVFVMTFACTSNHVLFLTNAMKKIDFQTIEAARNLGASQFTILRKVVLPVLKPTIFALTILVFLTGLNATSAPLIVGGRQFETITPMILTFSRSIGSKDLAIVLALILGLATIVVLSFMIKSEKSGGFISISKVKSELTKQKIESRPINIGVHIIAYTLFVIYIIPVILIIIFSFTDTYSISNGVLDINRFTLENYKNAFNSLASLRPYIVSISYGAVASLIVAIFTLICSRIIHKYKNIAVTILEYILMIPWFLPSTLIAIGLIISFNVERIFIFNNILTGTIWLLMLGYVIIKIPFSFRMTKAAFFGIDNEIELAARNLGASSFYTFRRVLFPIILPATAGVFALNFISILADYDLTVFLYHPIYEPLGVMIRNATDAQSQADTKALSLVYSVILMLISSVVIFSVYGEKGKLRGLKWKKR